MKSDTLTAFPIGTMMVWAVILGAVWLLGPSRPPGMLKLVAMFCVDVLAMYISQHVYPFHPWL